jgi:hypothetical protein
MGLKGAGSIILYKPDVSLSQSKIRAWLFGSLIALILRWRLAWVQG